MCSKLYIFSFWFFGAVKLTTNKNKLDYELNQFKTINYNKKNKSICKLFVHISYHTSYI